MLTVLTIGHGLRSGTEFLSLLEKFRVDMVVDVRSVPYSKRNPFFRRGHLDTALKVSGMQYLFLGDQLGGRPKDAHCYDASGHVNYEVLRTRPFYRQGIERLLHMASRRLVVILCSETDPAFCHRTRLIGETLHDKGVRVLHIDVNGNLRLHSDVMLVVNKGRNTVDLFSALS